MLHKSNCRHITLGIFVKTLARKHLNGFGKTNKANRKCSVTEYRWDILKVLFPKVMHLVNRKILTCSLADLTIAVKQDILCQTRNLIPLCRKCTNLFFKGSLWKLLFSNQGKTRKVDGDVVDVTSTNRRILTEQIGNNTRSASHNSELFGIHILVRLTVAKHISRYHLLCTAQKRSLEKVVIRITFKAVDSRLNLENDVRLEHKISG